MTVRDPAKVSNFARPHVGVPRYSVENVQRRLRRWGCDLSPEPNRIVILLVRHFDVRKIYEVGCPEFQETEGCKLICRSELVNDLFLWEGYGGGVHMGAPCVAGMA